MTHHGMNDLKGIAVHCRRGYQPQSSERFGRMFPDLAPAYTPAETLIAIGKSGGPMDGGAIKKRTKTVPVGQVIFGQFIDHDITLDASSSFDQVNRPTDTPNVRTPHLDLDCIYGAGPESHAYLYVQGGDFGGAKLLTGADEPGADNLRQNDLLRSPNLRAIIGDHRNDENRIVSQLQLGMIKFHNLICDELHTEAAAEGNELSNGELYEEARRVVIWHYQWAVVNDFLVAMCGRSVVNQILACGREYFCGKEPYIPIEFAVAAYRFGHSMVPMKIQIQKGKANHEFFGSVLGNGFEPLASEEAIVDWHEILETDVKRAVQKAEKLDTEMAGDLLELPFIPSGESSLATRNLLRGNSFLLPGGDKVAEKMAREDSEIATVMAKVESISNGEIVEGAPLWLYLLAEAEEIGRETEPGHFDKGEGLGPVGARIVSEVMIGLLELDETSYLGANRNWTPQEKYNSIGKMLAATNSDLL